MKQRKTPRAQRYDYTSPGGYFVTICTKDREHYFGEICRDAFETRPNPKTTRPNSMSPNPNTTQDIMQLNELGQYCHDEIARLSERKTVDIHEWVVMPNHIHLLLVVSNFTDGMNTGYHDRKDAFGTRLQNDSSIDQGQVTNLSLQNPRIIQHDNYQGPRLGQIIGVLKSNITKYANEHHLVFAWQSRYHDHIIRNEKEYDRIKYYIQTNPQNRETDSLQ